MDETLVQDNGCHSTIGASGVSVFHDHSGSPFAASCRYRWRQYNYGFSADDTAEMVTFRLDPLIAKYPLSSGFCRTLLTRIGLPVG